jgi:hypothetical protein
MAEDGGRELEDEESGTNRRAKKRKVEPSREDSSAQSETPEAEEVIKISEEEKEESDLNVSDGPTPHIEVTSGSEEDDTGTSPDSSPKETDSESDSRERRDVGSASDPSSEESATPSEETTDSSRACEPLQDVEMEFEIDDIRLHVTYEADHDRLCLENTDDGEKAFLETDNFRLHSSFMEVKTVSIDESLGAWAVENWGLEMRATSVGDEDDTFRLDIGEPDTLSLTLMLSSNVKE